MKTISHVGDYGVTVTKFFDDTVIREIKPWRATVTITIFITVNGELEVFKEYKNQKVKV